jgi:hypothetical protein
MANTTISTILATTAALALAACGGGSSAVNNNPTLPPLTTPPPADTVTSLRLFMPATNPAGGITEYSNSTHVYNAATANANLSNGLNLDDPSEVNFNYSNLSSGTDRDTSVILFNNVQAFNSNWGMTLGGSKSQSLPSGSFTYNGFSVFYSTEDAGPDFGMITYKALGTAVVDIDFLNNNGTIVAIANDGTRLLNTNITSITQGGKFRGQGMFNSQDRIDSLVAGPKNNPDSYSRGHITPIPVIGITETSLLFGNFHGPNGEELTAISAGNNHTVGIIAIK